MEKGHAVHNYTTVQLGQFTTYAPGLPIIVFVYFSSSDDSINWSFRQRQWPWVHNFILWSLRTKQSIVVGIKTRGHTWCLSAFIIGNDLEGNGPCRSMHPLYFQSATKRQNTKSLWYVKQPLLLAFCFLVIDYFILSLSYILPFCDCSISESKI